MSYPPATAQVVSPFPIPPTYARNYSAEYLHAGISPLPPPPQTNYVVFGEEYRLDDEIIRPLAATGIRQLYVNKLDWKNEMKKLNRSALAALCDLLEVLVQCPDHPDRVEKLNDIHDIFINMHHLVNEFRPIQARDTLRMMQEKQLEDLQGCVTDFKRFMDGSKATFQQVFKMEDMVRLPVPPRRPELEGGDEDDDVEEIERKIKIEEDIKMEESSTVMGSVVKTEEGMDESMGKLSIDVAKRSSPSSGSSSSYRHSLFGRRRRDDQIASAFFNQ